MTLPQINKSQGITVVHLIIAIIVVITLLVINNWTSITQYVGTTTIFDETSQKDSNLIENSSSKTNIEQLVNSNGALDIGIGALIFLMVLARVSMILNSHSVRMNQIVPIIFLILLAFKWKNFLHFFINGF